MYPVSDNPYRALHPFDSRDALDFFGRDALVEQLLEALDTSAVVIVVGAPAIGKTSLIEAGLLPALHERALDDGTTWLVTRMTAADAPLWHLQRALSAVSDHTDDLETLLHTRADGLLVVAERLTDDPDTHVLLVIEDWSQQQDSDEQARFLRLLTTAAQNAPARLHMILTLNAEVYGYLLLADSPLFHHSSLVRVLPLTADETERAITMPALRADVTVEPMLVTRLLQDTLTEPSALPWLQSALSELFDQRTSEGMTLAVYERIGGLRGALSARAERVYATLTLTQQGLARALWRRLAAQSVLSYEELAAIGDVSPIVEAFVGARLLLADTDPLTDLPRVRMPHAVLLKAWQRLSDWQQDNPDLVAAPPPARGQWAAYGVVLLLTLGLVGALALALNALTQSQTAQAQSSQAQTQAVIAAAAQGQAVLQAATSDAAQAEALQLAQTAAIAQQQAQIQAALASEARATSEANAAALQTSLDTLQRLTLAESALQALSEGDPDTAITLAVLAVDTVSPPDKALQALELVAPHVRTRYLLRDAGVVALAFYGDGSQLVTATSQGRLTLWGITTGEVSATYDTGLSLTTLADMGQARMVVGDASGRLRVVSMVSGETLYEAQRHTSAVTALRVLPDGQIISASAQGEIRIGAALDNALMRSLLRDPQPVTALALNADSTLMAFGTAGGDLGVIEIASGDPAWRISAYDDALTDLGWADDGLITVNSAGVIRWWEGFTGLGVRTLETHETLSGIAVSASGTRFATAGETPVITIRDTASGQPTDTFEGHQAAISDLAWNPRDHSLASASADGTVRVWLSQAIPLTTPLVLDDHQEAARAALFSVDGAILYSAAASTPPIFPPDTRIQVWDWQSGWVRAVLQGHEDSVTALALNAMTGHLVSSSRDRTLILWDTATGQIIQRFSGHTDTIQSVDISTDGTRIVSTSQDGSVIVWDTATGRIQRRLIGHEGAVNAGVFSADSRWIVTGGADGRVMVWDAQSGDLVREMTGHEGAVLSVAISADSRVILSGSADQTTMIWDAQTGAVLGRSTAQPSAITDVVYNADSTRFASGAADGSVMVWDALSGDALGQFVVAGDAVTSAAFHPDGDWLTATYASGLIRVYALERVAVLDWIRRHVYLRPLTCEEKIRYALAPCD